MAERVYRKKSTADVPSASIPDVTATVPKVEMPQQSVVASASTAGTGQRIFKKKAATSTPQGLPPQPAPRVYSVRPEVKAYRDTKHLQSWGNDVSSLSSDVTAYFENINAGNVPSDESYSQMMGRIDTALSSVDKQREAYATNADVAAYIDEVADYLRTVRADVEKYRGGLQAALNKETADKLNTARENRLNLQYGPNDQTKAYLNNQITAYRMENADKYNYANIRGANTKLLGHDAVVGFAQFNQSIYNAADWLIPDDEIAGLFGVENKVGEFFDSVNEEYDAIYAKNERLEQYANPTVAFLGDNVVTPTAQALPNLAVSIMSGGVTAPSQLSASGGSAVAKYFNSLANNPNFWLSFAQSGGGAYQSAKDRGATELEAQTVAWLTAFPSAMVEVRGGVEGIPKTEAGVWAFVKNAAEEGGEEVLQGLIENAASMAVFEQEKQWVSFTDTDALFSLPRMAQEFIGGVTVGAVLGGGFKATQYAYQSYQYAKIGDRFINGEGGVTISDAVAIGLSNAKGTDAYNAAVQIQKQLQAGDTPSPYSVGRMVAESYSEQAQIAKSIENTVLSTAKEWNIPTDAAETVAAAAVSLGQKVEFVSPEGMHNRYMAGEYDSATDTVRLNVAERNVDKLIGAVMAHEMVHTAEGTDQLQKLAQIAERMENHKNGAGAWEKLQADVKSKYAAAGKQLSDPGVKKEALAHWIGENLFKNKAFAKAVVDGDANVGNAFFYMIDRVRRAMGVKKASAGNLAMLERLFMQAIDARTIGPKEGDVQGAVKGTPVIDLSDHSDLAKRVEGVYGAKKYTIIQNYILEMLGDQPIQLSDGKTAIVDKSDARHIAHGAASQKTAEIAEIKQLVEKAELYATDSEADHPKFQEFYYYRATVKWGNDVFSIYLNVGRAKNDGNYHLYDITKKIRDTADRINGLERPKSNEGYAYINGVSDINVAQNAPDVNTHSMQEGAGIFTEDGGNTAQGALLSPESMEAVRNGTWREARAEGVDPNANVDSGVKTPSVADGDTSLGEGGFEAVRVDEAAVLETAVRSGLQGKQVVDVDTSAIKHTKHAKRYLDTLERELGTPELVRRMWNATQIERPTGTVEIDGRQVDANAYVDAYEAQLPNDAEALVQHLHRLEAENGAVKEQMYLDGTLEDHVFGGLKIDLQLFAAKRKLELLQLAAGEDGKKMRQFYEKRLLGNDENHCQELINLLAGRPETYNPIANQKTLAKAKENLDDKEYKAKLKKRLYAYNKHDLFDSEEVAAASLMINDAINRMELEEAADLVIGLSRKGTEAGRAVQAFSMMGRLTPEGVLKTAARYYVKAADQIVGDGADVGFDKLAKEILVAIEEAEENGISSDAIAERIRSGDGATSSTASGPAFIGQPGYKKGAQQSSDGKAPGDTANPELAGTPTDVVPQGEGQVKADVKMTREQLVEALTEDLAATEGAYLTRDAMADLIKRAVNECADLKGQVKRYVLKEIRKDDGALAQRIYEVYQKGDLNRAKMKRAMEEALGLPTLTTEDVQYIVEQTAKIQKLEDKPVEQADAIDDLYDYLGAKLPVSVGEKMAAWRKFAMLFNIRTHARNFFANLAYVGVRNVDSAIATGLELMAVKLNWMKPEERAAAFGWRCTAHGQQILKTIKERVPEAVLEMTGRGAKYEETSNPLMRHRKMHKSEWLNDLNDWNSEWLEREDIFFFKMAYTNALGQVMTARKATEVTDEMHAIAMKRALEATFRNKNVLSRMLSVPKRGLTSDDKRIRHAAQVYDVVLPFVNTPAAIMEQTAMHSPIGLAVGFAELFGKVLGKSDKAAADIINDFAKGIHGSALFYLGFMAVQWGILRIGYRSGEKDKAADEMEGRMENAIIIGDTAISIDWLQPLAAPLIMGGAVAEALADQDDDTLDSLFGVGLSAANSLLSLSMLQSFYDAVGSYGGDAATSLSTVAENAISQSVPTLLGQVARILDPVQRKVQDGTLKGSLLNPILAKIPFATRLLDPELDVWGNEVYRTGYADGAGIGINIAQQLAVPWNTKRGTAQDDPISAELLRLYHEHDAGAALPTDVTRKEAKAEGEDWTKLNRLLGGVNRLAVEEFINNEKAYEIYVETGGLTDRGNPKKKKETKYYRDMTDEERINVLSGIYEDSKAEVLGKTDHIPEEHLNDSERYIRDLLRRVQNGERGTFDEGVLEPKETETEESKNTYYSNLLRRMRNSG